jgi:hypothetical protein
MAAAAAVMEGLWVRSLAMELGLGDAAIKIFADNQGAIKLLKNPVSSMRSKHIDVAYHFARERVARGEVRFSYLATDKMLADMFTKPVTRAKLEITWAAIGVGMGWLVTQDIKRNSISRFLLRDSLRGSVEIVDLVFSLPMSTLDCAH